MFTSEWMSDGGSESDKQCVWSPATAGIHRGSSTSRCQFKCHTAQDDVAAVLPNQTPQIINDSCISETTLSLYNQSQGNSVVFRHRPRWCNFMIVHILCGWACASPAELIHPEVVTAGEKLVPSYRIMIALETLKIRPLGFLIGCDTLRFVSCLWSLVAAVLLFDLYLFCKFYVRNRNSKELERKWDHYHRKIYNTNRKFDFFCVACVGSWKAEVECYFVHSLNYSADIFRLLYLLSTVLYTVTSR